MDMRHYINLIENAERVDEGWKDMIKVSAKIFGIAALATLGSLHSANAQKAMWSSFNKPISAVSSAALDQVEQLQKEIVKVISDSKMRLPANRFDNVGGTFLVGLDINQGGKLEDYVVVPRAETNSTYTKQNAEMISHLLRGFSVSPVLEKSGIRVWVEINLDGREWDRKIRHGENVSSGNNKNFNYDPYNLATNIQGILLQYFEYPQKAKDLGIEGTVKVSMDVVSLRDNTVKNVKIIRSPSPILSDAVMKMLKKAYFYPQDGKEYVNSGHVVVDINFGAALR